MARSGTAHGLPKMSNNDATILQSYIVGKRHRTTIPEQCRTERASGLLELDHTVRMSAVLLK